MNLYRVWARHTGSEPWTAVTLSPGTFHQCNRFLTQYYRAFAQCERLIVPSHVDPNEAAKCQQ